MVISAESGEMTRIETAQTPQQLLITGGGIRNQMDLITPQPTVSVERNEQCSITTKQPRGHDRNQLEKAVQVGETALRKGERRQKILITTLLLRQALENLAKVETRLG